jgi:hypothetical protein
MKKNTATKAQSGTQKSPVFQNDGCPVAGAFPSGGELGSFVCPTL